MRYKVKFPVTAKLGSFEIIATDSPMESAEENALWHYNSALAHDGIDRVDEVPAGTHFIPLDATPALPRGNDLLTRGERSANLHV